MATELEIRVTAELREIRAALTQLGGDFRKVTNQANAAGAGTRSLTTGLQQSAIAGNAAATAAGRVQAGIAGAVTQVKLLVGGLGAIGALTALVRMADTSTRLAGQIRLVTRSQEEFNRAQAETFAIAQRTRQGLEGTVNLYARIARAGRTSQAQTLQLTESINQAVSLSFTTAQASEAALFQLGQGLGSGTLRGEELNSVLEQTPRLAQAIADGLVELGKIKDPGGLREYARQNGIAAAEVVAAIRTQRAVLEAEFAVMTPTVADAFTALKNAALAFVGDVDSANGASRQLADAILLLANNLGKVAELLLLGAKLWAAYYVAFRLVPALLVGAGTALTFIRTQLVLNTPVMAAAQAQWLGLASSITGATVASAGFSLTMNGAAIAAGSMATKIRAAAALALSAFVGWEIGTYLREEFLEVELAGLAFVNNVLTGFERLKLAAEVAGLAIKAAFLGAWNTVRDTLADGIKGYADAIESVDAFGLNAGNISKMRELAGTIQSTGSAWQDFQRDAAEAALATEDRIAAMDAEFLGLAAAAIDAKYASDEALTPPADGEEDELAKAIAGAVDQFALLKDAAERALAELDRLYEDAGISVAEYYAQRIRLQQQAIDADLAAAQRDAALATTAEAKGAALTRIIILERQRRDVAIQGARDQVQAENDLIDKLGEVYIRLLELGGNGARARTLELEAQYADLIKRLYAESDEAGVELVRRLINVEAAKAGLQQFQDEFSNATSALSQLEQTTAAQVAAGLLSNATAEERLSQARAATIDQLREQRESVAALYEQYRDPDTLLHLQRLDQQIAQLSISTEDWRGKIQDAATSSLTTFFKDLADGSTSAGEAVRNLAVNFTQALAAMAAQALAKRAIQGIFDLFSGGGGGEDGGATQVASAAAAGLAYAAPVGAAATAMGVAGGTLVAGASAVTIAAAALQAAATTLLIANSASSVAGVAHVGGIAGGVAGSLRNLGPYAFVGAPKYHSGGVAGVGQNEVAAVLQKGEEVITRNDPRHRYNGGQSAAQEGGRARVTTPVVAIGDSAIANALAGAAGEDVVLTHVRNNWEGLSRGTN